MLELRLNQENKADYHSFPKSYFIRDHGYRVANLSFALACELALDKGLCGEIYIAGLFHDVGKNRLNIDILEKSGKLTEQEMKYIRKHIYYGAVEAYRRKFSENIIKFIFFHHENYDGTGYYMGLKGEEIPIGSRILRICDVYDALMSERSYKKAYTKEEALKIMAEERNIFDPEIFSVFLKNVDRMVFLFKNK